MKLEPLAGHRHLVEAIASTLHRAWGSLPPWEDETRIAARLQAGASESAWPHTVVALDDNGVWTATGSLKLNELPAHPDKQHWLGEIFVVPEHRGQGLGSHLTRLLCEYAFLNGATKLFLYTPDQQALYARLGWKEECKDTVDGELVSIMALSARKLACSV